MKKNLITLALLALVAGVCISAKAAPQNKGKEIAMNKCSKSKKKAADDECAQNDDRAWDVRNGYSKEEYKAKQGEFASQRKSAAQKVMEGY